MHSGHIALVVGTRPEAIKLAPVARALLARGLEPRVLVTGQHEALELAQYGFPDLQPLRLECRGIGDPRQHSKIVAAAVQPHLAESGLLLVQGDTSSALGGALAGSRARVPVGHVEAGLRSHDSRHPWPEERFRIAIDHMAALLFAPTELSAANLRREGVSGEIHVTGNTGVDAALVRPVRTSGVRERSRPRILVTCHRRENWGAALGSIATALRELATSGAADICLVLHPNPRVASAMEHLLGGSGIELSPPCGHAEMLQAMLACDLVLTDSGGLQEEAPIFGIPLLVLRERTERPEAIASGNIELIGTDPLRIVSAVRRLLADPPRLARMSRPALCFGDGRAAERIASVASEYAGLANSIRTQEGRLAEGG